MRFKLLLATLTLSTLGLACSSPSDTTVTIGAAMTGTVRLFATDDGTYLSDASGATVALQATTYHTTTDASGKWTLNGVPPGIYNIVFSKPGYDSITRFAHKFSGAGVDFVDSVTLLSIGTLAISLDSIRLAPQTASTDTNVFVYFSYNTAAVPQFSVMVSPRDTNGSSWNYAYTAFASTGPRSFVGRLTRAYVRTLFGISGLWGSSVNGFIRVDGHTLYGSSVSSRPLPFTIPADSLYLDSLALNGSSLDIHGHWLGSDRIPIWFRGNRLNDQDTTHWKAVEATNVNWIGSSFTAHLSIPYTKAILLQDSSASGNVYLSAYSSNVSSNVISTYLP